MINTQTSNQARMSAFLLGFLNHGHIVYDTDKLLQKTLKTVEGSETLKLIHYYRQGQAITLFKLDSLLALTTKTNHKPLIEQARQTDSMKELHAAIFNRELMNTAFSLGFIFNHLKDKSTDRLTSSALIKYSSPCLDSITDLTISKYWSLGVWHNANLLHESIASHLD